MTPCSDPHLGMNGSFSQLLGVQLAAYSQLSMSYLDCSGLRKPPDQSISSWDILHQKTCSHMSGRLCERSQLQNSPYNQLKLPSRSHRATFPLPYPVLFPSILQELIPGANCMIICPKVGFLRKPKLQQQSLSDY